MRKNKYNAVTVIEGNTRFGSLKEARRFRDLQLMQAAGIVRNLEPHPAFDLWVLAPNGECVTFGRFTLDATYELNVGDRWERVYEDTKSPATRAETSYRIRKRAFEALYGVRVTEI